MSSWLRSLVIFSSRNKASSKRSADSKLAWGREGPLYSLVTSGQSAHGHATSNPAGIAMTPTRTTAKIGSPETLRVSPLS
jgi:hypothetical protein